MNKSSLVDRDRYTGDTGSKENKSLRKCTGIFRSSHPETEYTTKRNRVQWNGEKRISRESTGGFMSRLHRYGIVEKRKKKSVVPD